VKTDQVLAVDDDPATMATLREALKSVACEAAFAQDPMGAWELLQMLERPGVLVLGWVMAGMDGIALCRALREQTGRQPYVILIASAWRQDDLVAAFRAGADEYVHKPVVASDLAHRIRRGLRGVELREYPDRVHEFDPTREETTAEPCDPTTSALAGTVVAGRYRVISPLRSDVGSAVWEGFDEDGQARVAIWFTHIGGGRDLKLNDRTGTGRRSLTDPRNDTEFTVLEFGVTAGGITYVVTTFCEEWASEVDAARTRPMRRNSSNAPPAAAKSSASPRKGDPPPHEITESSQPTIELPAWQGPVDPDDAWRESRPSFSDAPTVMVTPLGSVPVGSPPVVTDPFLVFSNPLMTADESFTRVVRTAEATPVGAVARPRSWLNLRTAFMLAGACVAGAATATMRAPRTSAPISSIPPPLAPEAATPSRPPPPHAPFAAPASVRAAVATMSHEAAADGATQPSDAAVDAGTEADAALSRSLRPPLAVHPSNAALDRRPAAPTADTFPESTIGAADLAEAERRLQSSIAEQPRVGSLHARLGLVQFRRGNVAGALGAFRTASQLDHLNVSYLRWLARLQEMSGDRVGAQRSLRSVLTLNPHDPIAVRTLQRLAAGT
jgi:DNA-binding response OmpR family regulator/Flp pilus assembly protein TadD